MKKIVALLYCLLFILIGFSQELSQLKNVKLNSIGPSIMSGRVTAIAVNVVFPTLGRARTVEKFPIVAKICFPYSP